MFFIVFHFFSFAAIRPGLAFYLTHTVLQQFSNFNLKTAHPFRPSGRKGIAKRRATLNNRKEYAYNGRTPRWALLLKIGDFFLQPHHSLRYHHIEAQK
ncbi:MAG: hypothetical protein PUF10_06690 [Bacteroidales bacterium]|nr:hypothetical protein [Bacteroidales bacterium]